MFEHYSSKEEYEKDGLVWLEPMTAKEITDEGEKEEKFNSKEYYVEEKFDGTRATLHFINGNIRVFSRRVSKKTGWFCENTDSLPHIRDLKYPKHLEGTIIDGELLSPTGMFKDVSSTLNCKSDKAIEKQKDIGLIYFNAFDVPYYAGENITHLPLKRRKLYLKDVLKKVGSKHLKLVKYFTCAKNNAREYYFDIVRNGGEGVIIKDKKGVYESKRSKAFLKIKKLLTRDLILLNFSEPTLEYNGKYPTFDRWDYWETNEGDLVDLSSMNEKSREVFISNWSLDEVRPVSKYYVEGWVGNLILGVEISKEEKENLPSDKKFNFYTKGDKEYIEVCECGGFDEEMRDYFTKNKERLIKENTVIEVMCNEIFKETGKMRHPRFNRIRLDKGAEECVWYTHINS